ncbi:MAG: Omp28-related outer membrane protein [Bacteroidales bacterium]|nr:Omp28-related outer membrane protein [Bacteroidales bacterium]MCF8326711.1 Omp28-related outer membrane protein [Bacteroidales bacterium]
MRKIVLSLLAVIISASAYAQLPVDSSAQNKNVILEEFTGMKCPYCPDGHRIANDIMDANPGDVFVINIHTGSFAQPGPGQPDYTTSYGSAIASQADIAGFPAGTVNRHLFSGMSQNSGTAMSRGDWQNASSQILSQSSYANVALEADIDLQTRQMVVDVQVYFTGTNAPSSVNLNVALNQNNVAGPQDGASNYNPDQVLPNGDYNHMHMLRHLITGQWGDVIDSTGQGVLIQRQYTYTIPADINNVPMELGDLEVIGFLSEGHQEIITGDKAAMSYTAPAGTDIVDLAVVPGMDKPGWCDYSMEPKVKVVNVGNEPVDTFNVGYTFNDTVSVQQEVTNTLAAGDTAVITFSPVNLPKGENKIEVNANVDSTAHLLEMANVNNTAEMSSIYTFDPNPFGSSLWEEFDSYQAYSEQVDNSVYMGESGHAFVLDPSGVDGLTKPLGGYGKSQSSFFFYFYNMPSGATAKLVYEKMDFSGNTNTKLRFDRAYAQYSNENDKLKVSASTDCGNTWTTIYEKSGSNLATAPPNSNSVFFPDPNQWASDTLDLSSLDGESDVILSFEGISDYGNAMYMDNLVVYDDNTVAIDENKNVDDISIYPNPAVSDVNVDLTLAENVNVKINILNSMGQKIETFSHGEMNAGNHNLKLNTTGLNAGLYYIQVITGDHSSVKQLSVIK